jgi:antitoxin ParD1/3/4
MPTRNISLTVQQDRFLERMVSSGTYQSASEAVRDAVRLLQERRRAEAAKLRALRRHIQTGLDDLVSGDFVELDVADLDHYLSTLTEPTPTAD